MIRILSSLVLISTITTLSAQRDEAKVILDQLVSTYQSYDNLTMIADMTLTYPEEEPQRSKLTITQEGIKFVLLHPEQEIYCDGKDVYLYLPQRNEVQINDYDPEAIQEDFMITPIDLLRQYESGEYGYALTKNDGKNIELEFKPLSDDHDYSKYRISISTPALEIYDVFALGKDGSRIQFEVTSLETNRSLAADIFQWDSSAHPGVHTEDLRLD
ncbi:MAG: outer membrane lipoprotein carrier protein LolA [Bacteroidota bacterium]